MATQWASSFYQPGSFKSTDTLQKEYFSNPVLSSQQGWAKEARNKMYEDSMNKALYKNKGNLLQSQIDVGKSMNPNSMVGGINPYAQARSSELQLSQIMSPEEEYKRSKLRKSQEMLNSMGTNSMARPSLAEKFQITSRPGM